MFGSNCENTAVLAFIKWQLDVLGEERIIVPMEVEIFMLSIVEDV